MKNIFKTTGFDSIIGEGTAIHGPISVSGTLVVNGKVTEGVITSPEQSKSKAVVLINGDVQVDVIEVDDLTVCGTVIAQKIVVRGVLAVKGTAKLTAATIYYQSLVVEPTAVICAQMRHLSLEGPGTSGEDAV